MSREKQIERTVEYLNNAINVERNSYFGKGCITMPLIEADKILDILQGYRKQSEGEWREDVIAFCNVCSSCRAMVDRSAIKCNSGKLHYCPNCGAKMKGGGE